MIMIADHNTSSPHLFSAWEKFSKSFFFKIFLLKLKFLVLKASYLQVNCLTWVPFYMFPVLDTFQELSWLLMIERETTNQHNKNSCMKIMLIFMCEDHNSCNNYMFTHSPFSCRKPFHIAFALGTLTYTNML